jgi:hypothetical protein
MAKKKVSRTIKKTKAKVKVTQLRLFGLLGIVGILLVVFSFVAANLSQELPCANSISCIDYLSGEFDPNATVGEFEGKSVPVPQIATNTYQAAVLGDSTLSKKIFVDLTAQRIYAKEGDTTVYEFPISSGKPWWATPTGTFKIWIKLDSTRMSGGSREKGDYYNLPNVKYTMFFYNDKVPKHKGYGIHGAYWHDNFGQPMSHGCINMRNEDVEKIYNWATPTRTGHSTKATNDNPGTEIIIYGETPRT